MDYETLFVLYKSRKTLLKILEDRGYNVTPFEKFGPVEISAMASAGDGALRMDLEKLSGKSAETSGPDGEQTQQQGITKCRVIYAINRIRNRLPSFMRDLIDEDSDDPVNPATTEVIVVLVSDQLAEAFHAVALSSYMNKNLRLRISFFQAAQLVNNPLEHVLVPKHELLPRAEHDAFLKANKIKSKANLPIIKFHEDMIARVLGLLPGDIVKITRSSPSSGEYETYRVCAP